MMNMLNEWHTLFRSLGFTDMETKIYLACLELGPASAQDIAKMAKVSRVTTYHAIETLTERGLMSSFMKEKRKRFMVEPPERLISYAEGRIKHAEDAVKHAREAIDDLKMVQKGERPIVKIFEGKEALRTIQEDILNSRPEFIDEFGNIDSMLKVFSFEEDFEPFYKKLQKLEIKKGRRSILLKKSAKNFTDLKLKKHYLSPDEFDFHGDVLIYGSKVAISTFRNKQISILIDNKDISQTLRELFNFALRKK